MEISNKNRAATRSISYRSTSRKTRGTERAAKIAITIQPANCFRQRLVIFRLHENAVPHKALTLDQTLAEAHCSLGVLRIMWEYNWADGERELGTALSLNPASPLVRSLYAFWFLRPLGRPAEAFAENSRTLEVDPLSPFFRFFRAYLLYLQQEYELSIL